MSWTIKYIEKGEEHTLTVSGTPKDVETALAVIEGKHGTVVELENSEGRKYYKLLGA